MSQPTPTQSRDLARRRNTQARLSELGSVLGLATLGARAPQAVKFATRRAPRLAAMRPVSRMIAAEPKATSASNTLGALSIGNGAISGLNFAGLQRQEARIESKPSAVAKRDDRFLRHNRDRISPKAEEGYEYLREGRNYGRRKLVSGAVLSGAAGGGALMAVSRRKPISAVTAAALSAFAANEARAGSQQADTWEAKMAKIRAKAYERAESGKYGEGRELAKALVGIRPMGLPRVARPRVGGLTRRGNQTFTRRGSIPGTGRQL